MKAITFAITFLFVLIVPTGASLAQKPDTVFVIQTGHLAEVTSIAYSPNSKLLASASRDNTIAIWTTDNGRQLQTLVGHTDEVTSVAFVGNELTLVSVSYDGTARIWDITTGKTLHTLSHTPKGHSKAIDSVSVNADGTVIATGCRDNTIKLWDSKTGDELHTLYGHSGKISSLAFSPDGKFLVSGSHDHSVRLWNGITGERIRTFDGHPVAVMGVAFSRDGRYIASGGGGYAGRAVVIVWDIESGKQRYKPFETTDEWVSSLTFSPDGSLLLVGTNTNGKALHLWDMATGKDAGTLPTKATAVYTVAFSSDGKCFAYGGSHNAVTILNPKTWKEIRTMDGHVTAINSLALSVDGSMLVASGHCGIGIWDATRLELLQNIKSDDITALALSPQKDVLAIASNDKSIKLWDIASRRYRIPLVGHSAAVKCIAFNPDGTLLASGGDDNTIKLWDIATGKEKHTFAGHIDFVRAITFSPDGKLLASGSRDTTIKLWNTDTGREIKTLQGHANWVEAVTFSSNGRYLLSGSGDNTVKLWDISTYKVKQNLEGHKDSITSVYFSPDDDHAVSGSIDKTIRIWELSTGKEKILEGNSGGISSLAVSPDRRHVFSGNANGMIKKWDVKTSKVIYSMIRFNDDEWIIITPEGYFNASSNGPNYINVRVGTEVYAIDQFKSKFYRPDLVQPALKVEETTIRRESIGEVASNKLAPAVHIISPLDKRSVDKNSIELHIETTDNGGGIGNIIIYLNGARIVKETNANNFRETQSNINKILSFDIELAEGQNDILVRTYNTENSMFNQSEVSVTSTFKSPEPNLYAIIIGIKECKNETLKLDNAIHDAEEIKKTLEKVAKPLFNVVHALALTKPDETTKKAIIKTFDDIRKKAKPKDIFVFYDSSHGIAYEVNNEIQYFLLTSNVLSLSPGDIGQNALNHKELADLISSIPALKRVVILDTCDAGTGGKMIKQGLLRIKGLIEVAAIIRLKQTIGSAVFSATADIQYARAEYEGLSLFTYFLSKGLNGEADSNKDGLIDLSELANYTRDQVIDTSLKKFNRQQVPTNDIQNDFPIGKVK